MKKLFNFCVKWEPVMHLAGEDTDKISAGALNQNPYKVADDYDVFLYRSPWHNKVMRYCRQHRDIRLLNCVCGCRAGLGSKHLLKRIKDKDWFPKNSFWEGDLISHIRSDKEFYYSKKYHLEAGTGIDIIPGNRMPQRYGNKVPKNKMFQRNLAPHLFDIDYEGDYPDYIDKDFFKDKKYSIRLWTMVSDQGDIAIMKDYHYKFAIFKHKTRDEILEEAHKLGYWINPIWFHLTNSTHVRDIKARYNSYDELDDKEKYKEIEEWWNDPNGVMKSQYSWMALDKSSPFFSNYDEIYPKMCQYIKEYIDKIINEQDVPNCLEGRTWTSFGMDFILDENEKLYFIEANLDPGYKLFEPSGDLYKRWWRNVSDLMRKDDTSKWTMLKSKNKMNIVDQLDDTYEYADDARGHDVELLRIETSYPGSEPW